MAALRREPFVQFPLVELGLFDRMVWTNGLVLLAPGFMGRFEMRDYFRIISAFSNIHELFHDRW